MKLINSYHTCTVLKAGLIQKTVQHHSSLNSFPEQAFQGVLMTNY